MASHHILVDNAVKAEEAIRALKGYTELSVDCEGVQLGRNGELCLLQIAMPGRVYLIDIFVLRETVFDMGLRAILEDAGLTKLFYDCRGDCAALKNQYNVEVKGIADIQLLSLFSMKLSGKRWQFVSGLQKCMDYHLKGSGFSGAEKARVHTALDNDRNLWRKRPLTDDLLVYAAKDVMYLAQLRDKIYTRISSGIPRLTLEEAIKYASARYADFSRNNEGLEDDSPYLRTAMLPERILPEIEIVRGGRSFYIPFSSITSKCRSCCWQTETRPDGQCNRCYRLDQEKSRARN